MFSCDRNNYCRYVGIGRVGGSNESWHETKSKYSNLGAHSYLLSKAEAVNWNEVSEKEYYLVPGTGSQLELINLTPFFHQLNKRTQGKQNLQPNPGVSCGTWYGVPGTRYRSGDRINKFFFQPIIGFRQKVINWTRHPKFSPQISSRNYGCGANMTLSVTNAATGGTNNSLKTILTNRSARVRIT